MSNKVCRHCVIRLNGLCGEEDIAICKAEEKLLRAGFQERWDNIILEAFNG